MIIKPIDFQDVTDNVVMEYLETLPDDGYIAAHKLDAAMSFPILMVRRSFDALNDGIEVGIDDIDTEFYTPSASAMMGCIKEGVDSVIENTRQALIDEDVEPGMTEEAIELCTELGAIFRRLSMKLLNDMETTYNKSLN